MFPPQPSPTMPQVLVQAAAGVSAVQVWSGGSAMHWLAVGLLAVSSQRCEALQVTPKLAGPHT